MYTKIYVQNRFNGNIFNSKRSEKHIGFLWYVFNCTLILENKVKVEKLSDGNK